MSQEFKPLRGIWQGFWCIASAAASVGVMSMLFPTWAVGIYFGIVFAHELAHYAMAKILGQDPELPIFIPLGFSVTGGTMVWGINPFAGIRIAKAGPVFGGLLACASLIMCAVLGFMPGVWLSAWIIVINAFAGLFGSDARRRKGFKSVIASFSVNIAPPGGEERPSEPTATDTSYISGVESFPSVDEWLESVGHYAL